MTAVELKDLITKTRLLQAESQTLECKAAAQGCPNRLYDTRPPYSNAGICPRFCEKEYSNQNHH